MLYYPRTLETTLNRWMKKPEVLILKGPRQAGKTTLLKHLKETHGGTYLNMEIPSNRIKISEDPLKFIDGYKKPIYLDEIASVENAGKFLKLIYDEKKPKMVVTGSGAFETKENIGGELVGRSISFELYPLTFGEYLSWVHPDIYDIYIKTNESIRRFLNKGKTPNEPPKLKEIHAAYKEFTTWGGYPKVVLEKEKQTYLSNIVETALERDIFNYFEIREKDRIRNLLTVLSTRPGNLLSINSLNLHYRTAERYLSILSMEYIIHLLPPFHRNLNTEIRKTKKIYFHDLGIPNILSEHRLSTGQINENFAFIELREMFGLRNLRYWRTEGKAEVDFVLLKNKEQIPIEVKTNSTTIGRSFFNFIKNYRPEKALILTENRYEVREIEDTKIVFYPLHWL